MQAEGSERVGSKVSLFRATMNGRCQEGNEIGMLKPKADMQSGTAPGTPREKRQEREGGGT